MRNWLTILGVLIAVSGSAQIHNNAVADATCAEEFYMSYLRNADSSIQITDMAVLPGGDFIVCGSTTSPTTGTDALLIRFTPAGQKVWDKVYDLPGYNYLSKIIALKDGNVLAIGGYAETPSTTLMLKADATGNVIWCHQAGYGTNELSDPVTVREDANGNLYTTGHMYLNGATESIALRKFSAAGNVIWSKVYSVHNNRLGEPRDLVISGNNAYIAGYLDDTYFLRGLFMKVDNATGNIGWSRVYDLNESSLNFKAILPTDDGFVLCGLNQYNISDTTMFCTVDKDGQSPSIKYMQFERTRDFERFIRNQDGTIFYGIGSKTREGSTNLSFARIDLSKGVLWMKDYPQLAGTPRITTLHLQQGKVYFSGNLYPSGSTAYSFVARITTDGETGCDSRPFSAHFGGESVIAHDSVLLAVDKPMIVTSPSFTVHSLTGWSVVEDCKIESVCGQIDVLPAALTFCSPNDTITVRTSKNPACLTSIEYDYDHAQFRLIGDNDSIALFLPLTAGQSMIRAVLRTDCGEFRDSVKVTYTPSDSLNLGLDTTLCGVDNIQLIAPANFPTYTWSDGSHNPAITVDRPGTYSVTATDYCNIKHSDTVVVFENSVVPFDIGPDRTVCPRTDVQLMAPAGFQHYLWKISGTGDVPAQEVALQPLATTSLIATADYGVGCKATDTMQILVDPAQIHLGSDTSLCSGKNLLLDAGGEFVLYHWNTGARQRTIPVVQTGVYSVEGLSAKGCYVRDTISISIAPCYTGLGIIYPNAFTPDGDGKNDSYKPFVDMPLLSYRFMIFNRWGQVVFETTDPERSWNGELNGVHAAAGSYIWSCTYQTADGKQHTDKGSVVLVR